MSRSISRASRTSTGLTSTPSDGATVWIAPNWPMPERYGGIAKDRRPRHARRDLLSSSSHFPPMPYSNRGKAGGIAARPRQAVDKAGADRIGDCANTIGTVRVACSNGATAALPSARMTSGASATNSAACLRMRRHRRRPSECRSARCGRRSSPIAPAPAGTRHAGLIRRLRQAQHADARSRCCARAASGSAAAPQTPRIAPPQDAPGCMQIVRTQGESRTYAFRPLRAQHERCR